MKRRAAHKGTSVPAATTSATSSSAVFVPTSMAAILIWDWGFWIDLELQAVLSFNKSCYAV